MSKTIYIDGNSLTLEDIEEVALGKCIVGIKKDKYKTILKSREFVEEISAEATPTYGINTGFGSLSQVKIPSNQLCDIQLNLIRSHATAVMGHYPKDITRAVMLLRANVLAAGHSGIRPDVIELLLECLNRDVIPVIPKKGSVGASGDLAPLAHLALVLVGEGEAIHKGKYISGDEALKLAKLKPIKLKAKEGLSLINGTQIMTAVGVLLLLRAERIVKLADIAGAFTIEATRGSFRAFDKRITDTRPYRGSEESAKLLRKLSAGSEINKSHSSCQRVQDPYSFRCIPQVHGAIRDTINFVRQQLEVEINSVTDNPLVFHKEKEILSGGNFHGEPIAMALDFLAIAISELGNISERRIEKLMIPEFSQLPPFLIEKSGINSGFSMLQVTAAALVSENKILSHPASVDSIPTWMDKEDHVSMGATAANKALEVMSNVEHIIAIELIAAAQGIDFLLPLKPGKALQSLRLLIRKFVPHVDKDIVLYPAIQKITELISSGTILSSIEKEI